MITCKIEPCQVIQSDLLIPKRWKSLVTFERVTFSPSPKRGTSGIARCFFESDTIEYSNKNCQTVWGTSGCRRAPSLHLSCNPIEMLQVCFAKDTAWCMYLITSLYFEKLHVHQYHANNPHACVPISSYPFMCLRHARLLISWVLRGVTVHNSTGGTFMVGRREGCSLTKSIGPLCCFVARRCDWLKSQKESIPLKKESLLGKFCGKTTGNMDKVW